MDDSGSPPPCKADRKRHNESHSTSLGESVSVWPKGLQFEKTTTPGGLWAVHPDPALYLLRDHGQAVSLSELGSLTCEAGATSAPTSLRALREKGLNEPALRGSQCEEGVLWALTRTRRLRSETGRELGVNASFPVDRVC